mmetsp:Transcript_31686/g.109535  ORF Transcript_31686/g.109535 Transcript_31686/m.109535 type:complete len:211 (-) Transcript_31686:4970-5602(-)
MDPVRRSGGRHLDRKHEHRSRRQQEAVPHFRRDHVLVGPDDDDVRARGLGRGVAGDGLPVRDDLHGTELLRTGPHHPLLVAKTAAAAGDAGAPNPTPVALRHLLPARVRHPPPKLRRALPNRQRRSPGRPAQPFRLRHLRLLPARGCRRSRCGSGQEDGDAIRGCLHFRLYLVHVRDRGRARQKGLRPLASSLPQRAGLDVSDSGCRIDL